MEKVVLEVTKHFGKLKDIRFTVDKKWVMWVSNDRKDKPLILKTGGMIGINRKKFKKLREVINNEALDRFASG